MGYYYFWLNKLKNVTLLVSFPLFFWVAFSLHFRVIYFFQSWEPQRPALGTHWSPVFLNVKNKWLHHCCFCAGKFSRKTFPFLQRNLLFAWVSKNDHFLGLLHIPEAPQLYFIDLKHILWFGKPVKFPLCLPSYQLCTLFYHSSLVWGRQNNAPLVMRGSMFAVLFEQITFRMVVISTEGLQYVETPKIFQDLNTKWQERLAKRENPWCDIACWL